ncbi:MAG: hypothetical protein LBV70_03900 [Candidatus Adiutrix sp.]|jgi:hypothetical protein|nr:hypothetical protein [Candidatus Adiutrix sp.]
MRALCCFLTLLVLAGCSWTFDLSRRDPASLSALNQYKAAQIAFQEKLAKAPGLSLAELRARWGTVRQGITYKNSTIYNWVRTISVTPPPGAAAKLDLGESYEGADSAQPLSLSCMAVFIVNQKKVVDEASSEGHCLEPDLMPGWRPVIETAARLNMGLY